MTTISATMIADSVGEHSPRLSTILTRSPRWIHAEGRTHRRLRLGEEIEFELATPSPMSDPNLSRNASSSRAVPVPKMLDDVLNDPAIPIFWGKNQRGMQAEEECAEPVTLWGETGTSTAMWLRARDRAVEAARAFHEAGYHKQLVNRLIEPFSYINVLWTGTKWTNFLGLRLHGDAEPHMLMLAQAIKDALDGSTPKVLKPGEWHLPFVQESDRAHAEFHFKHASRDHKAQFIEEDLLKLSVARCASLSYRTVDDRLMTRHDADRLYDRLLAEQPIHASPAEHQGLIPVGRLRKVNDEVRLVEDLCGNLGPGWIQFRKLLPNEEILQ